MGQQSATARAHEVSEGAGRQALLVRLVEPMQHKESLRPLKHSLYWSIAMLSGPLRARGLMYEFRTTKASRAQSEQPELAIGYASSCRFWPHPHTDRSCAVGAIVFLKGDSSRLSEHACISLSFLTPCRCVDALAGTNRTYNERLPLLACQVDVLLGVPRMHRNHFSH